MGSDWKYVEFTFDWTHRWADYDQIGRPGPRLSFITSYKNVAFRWSAKMCAAVDESKIEFYIYYDDGPWDKMSGVKYEIGAIKSDKSLGAIRSTVANEYHRSGLGWGWATFEDSDSMDVRTKYGLHEYDSLTYEITIKIPIEAFSYYIPSPTPAPCTPWSIKLFNSINNAENNSWLSDTKVAGRDGIVFNCHKAVVASESKALETIFQYPPVQEETGEPTLEDEQSNSKKRKASAMDEPLPATPTANSGYIFPNLTAASLKSLLEYLYTGKATTSTLTVTELIEIGDAGEQYDLQPLKKFCAAELWQRMIQMDAVLAFEIARFADLHNELRHLKHRALDIIVENYEYLGMKTNEMIKQFGGTRSQELCDELTEYMDRRLSPEIDRSID